MGIRFICPECDKRIHVKSFLAGKRGICPKCGGRVEIPATSEPLEAASAAAGPPVPPGGYASASAAYSPSMASPGQSIGMSPMAPAPMAPAPLAPTAPVRPAAIAAGTVVGSTQPSHVPTAPAAPYGTGPAVQSVAPASVAPQPVAPASYPTATPVAAPLPAAPVTPVGPSPPAPSVADPFAEAPHAKWYVRPPSGGQFGPAAADVMRRWITEGRVSADSLVWREGWADWKRAASVFPEMGAAAASIAPAAPHSPAEFPAAAPITSGRAIRSRRRSSSSLAIGMFISLGFIAVALLVALIFVLNR